MTESVKLTLPQALADQLIEDGVASRWRTSRDGGAVGMLAVAVEVINTGDAVVTVVAAVAALRRIIGTLVRRGRDANHGDITVKIWNGTSQNILQVNPSEPDAEQRVSDFVSAAYRAQTLSGSPGRREP